MRTIRMAFMGRMKLGVLLMLLLDGLSGYAQTGKLNYWRDVPGFLEEQTRVLGNEIQAVLKKNPPGPDPSASRKLALFAIDGLLHDTRLDSATALKVFMKDRMKLVLDKLKEPFSGKGMQVYKLYNQGFVVRTPSVTIGFDLVLAHTRQGPLVDSVQMADIVRSCDVLFVSHQHGDHADPKVAKMFTEQHKHVFVPTGMWEHGSSLVQPLRDSVVLNRRITLQSGKTIGVTVFPGHQDETVLNNVYAVNTQDGYTVMHTGDQYNKKDLEWMQKVHQVQKVDVLLMHCWINDAETTVKGVRPRLVISGHENEMAHTIDHREPYWLTFRRMMHIEVPFLVMAWGESYWYR